ncbi:hypothetical protein MMC25_002709 [Agyrium rufum]|nr:hypothetical protein [Agyrium rufum]
MDDRLWNLKSGTKAISRTVYTPLSNSPIDECSRQHWWRCGEYRRLAVVGIAVATAVLALNIALLGWSLSLPISELGLRIWFEGDCSKALRSSVLSHLAINVLGTLLLALSNASMQCLSAPTRDDIDLAHAHGRWLHIGAGSIKNVFHVCRRRKLTWIVLLLSSLPLHLIYNSVIIQTSEANAYNALVVTQDFLNSPSLVDINPNTSISLSDLRQIQADAQSYTRLETSDCIAKYSTIWVNGRSNVILMSNYTSQNWGTNGTVLSASYFTFDVSTTPFGNSYNKTNKAVPLSDTNAAIEYCLSNEIMSVCSLQVHVPFLMVIAVANVFKIACFAFIVVGLPRLFPLITVGDAVASFIENPDPATAGSRILSRKFVEKSEQQIEKIMLEKHRLYNPLPRQPFSNPQHHWQASVSLRQRVFAFFSWFLWLLVGGTLLVYSLGGGDGSLSRLWRNGFGNLYPSDVFPWTSDWPISANVLFANMPQILVSFLYFTYNQFITQMCVSSETMWFAVELLSASIHWATSQALYSTSLSLASPSGQIQSRISGVGYSPLSLLITYLIGALMAIALIILGRCKLPRGIPVLGSCSLAISAACHGHRDRKGEAKKPLMYGVVEVTGEKTGRVGFSADPVEPFLEGWFYDANPEAPEQPIIRE